MNNRVVITGMGVVSPLGNDIDVFWDNIRNGVCGIDFIKAFDTSDGYDVKLAAEVKDFNPVKYINKREARRLDRFSQFAIYAAMEAIDNSAIDLDKVDKTKLGVIIGTGIGGLSTIEKEARSLYDKGPRRVSPFFIPMSIGNMGAGNVAIYTGAKGVCSTVVTACAAGTHSIGEAYRLIKSGVNEMVLAGGSEASITPLGIAGFQSLKALSESRDPKRASIPFDKERNGFVMGEGAGVLFMESLEHALDRKANIIAEVVGYGATGDAYHMTSPDPTGDGAARAMEEAISEAGVSKSKVGYINAHGTSTPYNDSFETLAIKKVFANISGDLAISSTKSMTGHLLGAAGAIEAIASAKALEDSFIPPTIGYINPDPDCDLDYVPNNGRQADISYAMSNSLGFGGHNASLLMKKWEGRE
ncbi:MAG: beta-ketoacyl-ACP synthase II [Epulopiscium sp.]|nr:beta-ketoacyl-ACP synthase II [Candidatus Epulonipiscium sp.]